MMMNDLIPRVATVIRTHAAIITRVAIIVHVTPNELPDLAVAATSLIRLIVLLCSTVTGLARRPP